VRPVTKYARNGDVSIAHQVFGDGPRDLVFVHGFVSNIEVVWGDPVFARFLEELSVVRDVSARGKLRRDIRNIFVPGEARDMCVFEALNAALREGAGGHGTRPFSMRTLTSLTKGCAGEIQ